MTLLKRIIFAQALKYLVATIVALTLIGCEKSPKDTKEGTMNILHNQPVFEFNIKSFGVSYGALINGVYTHSQFDPEATEDLTLPINHFFKSGKNKILLKVVPDDEGQPFNSSANIELTLTAREFGTNEKHTLLRLDFNGANPPDIRKPNEEVTHLNTLAPFKPSESGEVVISSLEVAPIEDYAGGLDIIQHIDIPSSLPRWKFFDSDQLPHPTSFNDNDYDNALLNLSKEYEKIQIALEAKNIDNIISLFKERSDELDLAFYEKPGTTQMQLRDTLLETVSDTEMKASPIKPEHLGFGLSENEALRELTRNGETAAIGYDYKDGGSRGFPIIFRHENGQCIITR